jgi:hypothetical protein
MAAILMVQVMSRDGGAGERRREETPAVALVRGGGRKHLQWRW